MYSEEDIRRLGWHCRRGMLELDVVLKPFLDQVFSQLDLVNQQRFERLLGYEDPQLFRWIMRAESPQDADMAAIIELLLSRVPN